MCGEFIKHKFSDIATVNTGPHNIINELWNSYNVHLSYKKSWRLKEVALKSLMGSDKESYAMLFFFFAYTLENVTLVQLFPLRQRNMIDSFALLFCLATFI